MSSGGIKYFYKVHKGKVKGVPSLSSIWNLSLKPQYDKKPHCDPTDQCSSEAGTKDSGDSILLTTLVTILFISVSFFTILVKGIYDSGIFLNKFCDACTLWF